MTTTRERRPRSWKSKKRKDKSKLKSSSASKLNRGESPTSRSNKDWLKNRESAKNKGFMQKTKRPLELLRRRHNVLSIIDWQS
jgi:hypothetical protein